MLDLDSATTLATIAGGLVFARAQYAAAVRPMISWVGSIVKSEQLSDELVWLVRAVNGSSNPAVFSCSEYCVRLVRDSGDGSLEWVSRTEVIRRLNDAGLSYTEDYDLPGPILSFPLSVNSPYHLTLGLFTKKAMEKIEDVLIKITAIDQAGDTHQRIAYCMRGAKRDPKGISTPLNS